MANAQTSEGTGFKQDVQRLGQGVDTLKTDVANLGRGAVDAARSGVAELRQGAQNAVDAAKDKFEGAKDVAREKFEEAKATAADAAESFRGVIVRNPVASVGIAAGIGILIGMAMCRSRS